MYHAEDWSRTSLGTPISLSASHAPAEWPTLRPIVCVGGVHGDEPLGVELAEKTLAHLKSDAEKSRPESKAPWIIIPCLNVDGFARGSRVNARGVDLNRNYPARSWSPAFEKERYYPGPKPGSEGEVRALVGLIMTVRPRLLIHFHSWEPMVVCAGAPGRRDAERLARSSGYALKDDIGYPTPGSLSEFGWTDQGIPVICTEESDATPAGQTWSGFGPGLRDIFLDASMR